MKKLKFILPLAIGSVLPIAGLAMQCTSNTNETSKSFIPVAEQKTSFDASKQLDYGFENTTTRPGMPILKVNALSAIKAGLWIKNDNQLQTGASNDGESFTKKFIKKINEFLKEDQKLSENLEIDKVYVSSKSDKSISEDFIPSTYEKNEVEIDLVFKIISKDKKIYNISGPAKIKVSGYRVVDADTLAPTTDSTIIISGFNKTTKKEAIEELNKYFNVSDEKNTNIYFPVPNLNDKLEPIYKNSDGKPLPKRALPDYKIDQFVKLYKNANTAKLTEAPKGNFPKPRVGRAIEKIEFMLAEENQSDTTFTKGLTQLKVNVKITFIPHWRWKKTAEGIAKETLDWTLKGVVLKINDMEMSS
ncbi:hypothetical protein [Mycoplasmopsis cricetuli]|uniref:hypothetical protein n=1 Tax=Mycoplasmopsis cricetuli TaxID=171283 RepID=UPI00046EB3EB|nr:hypothetical protein [Mycoplasmopsis cricetuli]